MAKILEISPNNFATDVILNVFLRVKFDEAIDRSTVTDSTVILVKTDTEEVIPGVPDYIVGTKTITFQLYGYLAKNSQYNVIIVGGESGVQTLSGENWSSNSFVSYFTTGESVDKTVPLAPAGAVAGDGTYFTGVDGIYKETFGRTGEPVTHIVTTGAQVGPSGTIEPIPQGPDQYIFPPDEPGVFEVSSTIPTNGAVDVKSNEIKITFSDDIDENTLTDRVIVTAEDLLGLDIDERTYLNSVADNVLTITPSGVLVDDYRPSTVYSVLLKSDIADPSGIVLGSDYTFSYRTFLLPFYSTLRIIRSNIGNLISKIDDIEIERLIYENSVYILSVAKTPWDESEGDDIPEAAKNYVACKTKLDLVNRMYFDGGPVTSKSIDDFSVSHSRGFLTVVMKKIDSLTDCVKQNLGIIRTGTAFAEPLYAVKGEYDSRRPSWQRLENVYFDKENSVDKL